jgi:hypothetical protein
MTETPRFTLTFQQMFLLVNRLKGATVLLPAGGHTATLAGSMLPTPITLTGADVIVRRDGVDQVDAPTLRPGARYLPYLDYVFHGRIVPAAKIRSTDVPADVHARVLLAGGYLTELPASDPAVRDVLWQFVTTAGEVMLTQALTDRLQFTLPLDPASKYELVIKMNDTLQVLPIPPEGADLVLLNTDAQVKGQPRDNGFHRLREYALIYNLTSASTIAAQYPYPTAYTQGVGGSDQPICGGGQTDDGDPPPP